MEKFRDLFKGNEGYKIAPNRRLNQQREGSMPETNYDVAIVGAGFSGPILAAKIAEKGVRPNSRDRLKVALIEAGPYLPGAPHPGYGVPFRRQRFGNLRDSNPSYHWEGSGSARVVGGSSRPIRTGCVAN